MKRREEKKTYFILLILFLAVFLGGCTLPQNLSHFAPGQGASKTVGEEQSLASPLAVLEPSCGENGCEVEELVSPPALPAEKMAGVEAIGFWTGLIDEGKVEEAVLMMTDYIIPDSPSSNAWHDNLNSIESMAVVSIEPDKEDGWTEEKENYKVVLDVKTKTGEIVYGWMPGGNTRWIEVVKDLQTGDWQINFITSAQ